MKRQYCRGFTFIELMVFVVIVTIALLGVLAAFMPAVRGSADPLLRKQALNIAESTLREVMLRSFQNDINDAGNTSAVLGCTPNTTPRCQANNQIDRGNYNDVDDYNGFDQTGVKYTDGVTPVLGLENYRVVITVAPSTLHTLSGASLVKQVTVTVSAGAETVQLSGFRTNYE